MTPEMWTAIIGVGGFSVIVPKLVDGIIAWRTGRAADERVHNRTMLERLADAEDRAAAESEWRRSLEEYAGRLRLLLVESGVTVPPWPPKVTVHGRHNNEGREPTPP